MGPIPGISWADVLDVGRVFLLIAGWIWIVWALVDTPGRDADRRRAGRLVVGTTLPLLFILAIGPWLPAPDLLAAIALLVWCATVLIALFRPALFRFAAAPRDSAAHDGESSARGPDTEAEPLQRGAPAADPGSGPGLGSALAGNLGDEPDGETSMAGSATRRRRRRWPWAVMVAALIVAPRAAAEALTQTPCEQAEIALAGQRDSAREAEPAAWMPAGGVSGFALGDARETTLGTVAAGRKNPAESRRELTRDGFVGGYEQRWDGFVVHVEFEAQRFATKAGAKAFQTFAVRYACQFANEAFQGPGGSVGLQIRFATGAPIGEQISWVSNTTRVIVFASLAGSPPDHSRIIALMQLVSP